MLVDEYISESAQESIRKSNCEKINNYVTTRETIVKWYDEFGFDFPYSSENNFRDAWFHYKKLYQEHSTYEVICQIATFDEHLQRAEKDSIIYFFQKISESLEFWYYIAMDKKGREQLTGELESDIADLFIATSGTPNSWVSLLQERYSQNASEFAVCCLKVANTYILTRSFCVNAQKMLHTIKNLVLEIRIGGARIQRLDTPGDYLEKFRPCFEQLKDFCNQYRIKELIVVSELIKKLTTEGGD